LKLDQAQFRELEAFAKFGSDLDAATRLVIDRGRRNQEILKQAQYSPVPVGQQVAIIYASINGVMDKVPASRAREFEKEFIGLLQAQNPQVISGLGAGKLDDSITDTIKKVGSELAEKYA
jgi:F-type H+-transporting ATPase subunit alpha